MAIGEQRTFNRAAGWVDGWLTYISCLPRSKVGDQGLPAFYFSLSLAYPDLR